MKKFLVKGALTLIAIIVLNSCGGGSDSLDPKNCVPKDAHFAVVVHPGQWETKGYSLRKLMELNGDEDFNIKKWFESGIDTTSNVFFFADVTDQFNGGYIASVGKVSDTKKFQEYLKSEFGEVKKIDEDDISYVAKKGMEDTYIAYKAGVCVTLNQGEFSKLSLQENLKRIYSLSTEESAYGSEELFKKQVDDGYDLSLWYNLQGVLEALDLNEVRVAMSIIDMKNTYASIGVKFEKGKIVIESSQKSNDETTKLLSGILSDKGLSDDILDALPGDNLLAYSGMNINLSGIVDMLKKKGLIEPIDKELKMLGLNAKDIASAFTGEFAFTFNGVELTSTNQLEDMKAMLGDDIEELDITEEQLEQLMNEPGSEEPTPRFSLTIGYNALSKVGLMIKGGLSMLKFQGFENNGKCWTNREGVSIYVNKDYIQIIGSAALTEGVNKDNLAELPNEARIALSDNNCYSKIEIAKLINSLAVISKIKTQVEKIVELLPITVLTSKTETNDGIMSSIITIEMKDATQYSLELMVEFFDKVGQEELLAL